MKYKPVRNANEVVDRFAEAWNNNNPDGIANLFYEHADFVNVTGKWWDNKTDIWKAHDFGLRVIFQHSKLEILKVKEKLLSKDVAVVHARIQVTGQTEKDGETAGKRETMFLFVLRKENGIWLCESAQNTDIIFGKQTNIRDEKGNLKAVNYKEKKGKITRDLNEEE